MITDPDLIVLADETLLSDPSEAVLAGQESASAIFINCTMAERLIEQHGVRPPVYTFDVTGRTREILGRASALSAGLGAAAARLIGIIDESTLLAAMREEFEHLGVPPDVVDKNVQIGRGVFTGLPALGAFAVETAKVVRSLRDRDRAEESMGERGTRPRSAPPTLEPAPMASVEYHDPVRGAPSVLHAGNAEQRQTGAWRIERPIIDRNVCTRCGLCFVECPDGAISLDAEGYPVIDYDHCKGCMICRQLCPLAAIGAEQETRAW
jgi:pyruvate ferredoxin oxidoreductase gamma subunit